MIRPGHVKFPSAVQLFKFCQKVLTDKKGEKIHDQEIGGILDFNPSDCSHWKRGEKNIKSVFALSSLAEALQVEVGLIYDLASGTTGLDEAYFEYQENRWFEEAFAKMRTTKELPAVRARVEEFVSSLHKQANFLAPPLYLPEVLRFFTFINSQPTDMMDKLSRVLKVRAGVYTLQFKKGELKPQIRQSLVKDLAKIIFQAERSKFPELGPLNEGEADIEEALFKMNLLIPRHLLEAELEKVDAKKDLVAQLAQGFWVSKSLISYQLQDVLRQEPTAADVARVKRPARPITPELSRLLT